MKRNLLFALLLLPLSVFAQNELTVSVDSIGTLSKYLPDSIRYKISSLTISGDLNGADFALIKDIAGRTKIKDKTDFLLKKIDLSEVTIIESKNGLKTKAEEVPDRLFAGARALEHVVLPTSATSIGKSVFDGCKELQTVVLPDELREIHASAFNGCEKITEIELPESLVTIEDHVFTGCTALERITIPKEVTRVGANSFENCKHLTSIDILGPIASVENATFRNCEMLK